MVFNACLCRCSQHNRDPVDEASVPFNPAGEDSGGQETRQNGHTKGERNKNKTHMEERRQSSPITTYLAHSRSLLR